jgi:ribose transport system substrate-binding protein
MSRPTQLRRLRLVTGGALAALLVLAGCTSNEPESSASSDTTRAVSDNDDPGEKVVIGF